MSLSGLLSSHPIPDPLLGFDVIFGAFFCFAVLGFYIFILFEEMKFELLLIL
jgi:hypothetical protein